MREGLGRGEVGTGTNQALGVEPNTERRMTMTNRYAGRCHDYGKTVESGSGMLERIGRRWVVWGRGCYNRSDNSGEEDRCCGNRAYEDKCSEMTGCDREYY